MFLDHLFFAKLHALQIFIAVSARLDKVEGSISASALISATTFYVRRLRSCKMLRGINRASLSCRHKNSLRNEKREISVKLWLFLFPPPTKQFSQQSCFFVENNLSRLGCKTNDFIFIRDFHFLIFLLIRFSNCKLLSHITHD